MIKALSSDEFTSELIAPMFEEVASAIPDVYVPDKLNLPHVVDTWKSLMREEVAQAWAGYVGGKAVGVLGGLFITEFFTGQPMAMEQFWFVLREHRSRGISMKLFRAFEKEAERRGAKQIWAGSSRFHAPARMNEMYHRLGYQFWGATYRKLV